MPGSNAGHLPQPLMSFPGEFLCIVFSTFETVTLGDTNDVNHLILVENSRDGHSLLQVLLCPLNLHDVVLLHQKKLFVHLFLSCLILPLLTVLGEGLLLALVPKTPKKSALALVTEMLGKDGFKGTLAGIIFGPCTHPPPVLLTAPVGQEPHVSMSGCMEFAMRLIKTKFI
uniref:Uncharacterized protein n=1 Tax=Anabas testudineus TaxID=64144 RepID=A0A7N6BYZ5_ANATE